MKGSPALTSSREGEAGGSRIILLTRGVEAFGKWGGSCIRVKKEVERKAEDVAEKVAVPKAHH